MKGIYPNSDTESLFPMYKASIRAVLTSSVALFCATAAWAQVPDTASSPANSAAPAVTGPETPPVIPAAPSVSSPIPAAPPSATASNDTEIVVTALKRATNLQRTPLAISAIGAQSLANQGITDSSQLARATPNLVIRENSNGGSRVTIRNIYASGEPTVGLYYDETPITGSVGVSSDAGGTTPDIRLFDVERVEVLRGPQGTLYGAGSMAGTVRLIFNKPDLYHYDGSMSGQLSTVSHGDLGYNLQGEVNVPIAEGVLAARAVGFYEHQGGWLENSTLGLHDFNKSKSYGGRLLVRFRPVDNLTIDGMAVLQDRHGYSSSWDYQEYVNGGPKYDQSLATLTPQRDKLQLYSGTLNWDFGFATLTAIASYSKRNLAFNFDYTPYFTGAAAKATPTSAGCLRYNNIPAGGACDPAQLAGYRDYALSQAPITAYQPQSTRTSTQEVRLANGDHRLQWTIGGYHSYRKNFVDSSLDTTDAVTGKMLFPHKIWYRRTVLDILEQYAAFGEVTYKLTHKLSLTAGLRYFDYKKTDTGEVQVGNIVVGNYPQPPITAHSSENGTVLKFNASYQLTRDVMLYASASQGFRPGGVNESIGLPAALGPYHSDSLWDYEIGFKTAWFDRKLIINGDIFQINWKNLQVSASANDGAFGFITNAGDVRVRGIEIESTIRPIDRLTLQASGSYTVAKLRGDEVAPPGITIIGAGSDGDYVPMTPKWTLQGSAGYVFPVSDSLEVLTYADVNYMGPSWTQFDRVNAYEHRLPGYALTGLRFGLQSSDNRWGVYAFVNNVFNVLGLTSKNGGASTGGLDAINVVSVRPRTIGLNFRTKF